MWYNDQDCVHFRQALQAVAFLSFANQQNVEWLRIEAEKLYCRSLPLVARLLDTEEEAKRNTTLATIQMFGFYETLYKRPRLSYTKWNTPHHYGRKQLIRLWGKKHLKTQVEIGLYSSSFAHLVSQSSGMNWKSFAFQFLTLCQTITSLAFNLEPSDEAETWLKLMDSGSRSHPLHTCNVQASRLVFKFQRLFDTEEQDESWMLQLLQATKEAFILDHGYQEWSDSATGIWCPRTIRGVVMPPALPFSSRSDSKDPEMLPQHVYQSIFISSTWNIYRSSRIHLHEVLLHCISLISSHPYAQTLSLDFDDTISSSKTIISDLVTDICACSSFCLGIIDSTGNPTNKAWPLAGYLVFWPTYVALASAEAGSQREALLRGNLEYVANVLGIGIARQLASREKPNPWNLR